MPKVVKKGKKPRRKRKPSRRWLKYKIEAGKAVATSRFCPRCGPGYFLAKSEDRLYCGRCHYTEFITEEKEEKKENPGRGLQERS